MSDTLVALALAGLAIAATFFQLGWQARERWAKRTGRRDAGEGTR